MESKRTWCRQRSLWDQEWNSIVFSDESRFCLGMYDGRVRVRRRRGERRNPQFFVERHVHHTVGVMVWGAKAYGSRSPLIFIRGNMNAQRYIHEVLEPHLLPYFSAACNGGVVAFVRSSLSCSRDLSLESDRKDILWLRLNSKTSPKFICCLYRSPSNHNWDDLLEYLAVQIDFLNINHPASEVVLLGDFNAHNELWLGSNKTDAAGRAVEAFALTQGLTQLVTSLTFFPCVSSHASSLLDLFLTTHPAPYSTAVLSPLGNSDHGVVGVRFWSEAAVAAETRTGRKTWHYGHADWKGLRDFFSSFPWRDVCFTDADASTEYIPHTKFLNQGSNGWFNKSQADVDVRNAKTQHDIKVRHRVMSQRNGSRKIEKNFSHSSLHHLVPSIQRVPHTMREVTFRHKTVRRVLLSLDINKATGCAAELAPVLSRLFQISYESGTSQKTGICSCKVMERCINRELLDYLERHTLISDRQYGFRHQRSTGDLLAYVTQLWSKLIQSHGEASCRCS
ncbi:unnamed protein product [Acanthoscelides obtectus]|uniref:Endonuclease/exonuclease/phosphatase domain-containing protein n=1 Tax=Acanthoscelides obtectus TaxID=200917 RepID=A0A9P0VQC6_ACAOB|nr:unnamed protein product [Acanthoscelides obtectus]CAK1629591.1 hypothetical protein AOBTE_LOCUS5836 [Acanthoscelides obtectus]